MIRFGMCCQYGAFGVNCRSTARESCGGGRESGLARLAIKAHALALQVCRTWFALFESKA